MSDYDAEDLFDIDDFAYLKGGNKKGRLVWIKDKKKMTKCWVTGAVKGEVYPFELTQLTYEEPIDIGSKVFVNIPTSSHRGQTCKVTKLKTCWKYFVQLVNPDIESGDQKAKTIGVEVNALDGGLLLQDIALRKVMLQRRKKGASSSSSSSSSSSFSFAEFRQALKELFA
jgi:hypothetical protein